MVYDYSMGIYKGYLDVLLNFIYEQQKIIYIPYTYCKYFKLNEIKLQQPQPISII